MCPLSPLQVPGLGSAFDSVQEPEAWTIGQVLSCISEPGSGPHRLLAVQQLLLKGLLFPETQLLTIEVRAGLTTWY